VTAFDVFLSHNGKDKPQVRALKQLLSEQEKPLRAGWMETSCDQGSLGSPCLRRAFGQRNLAHVPSRTESISPELNRFWKACHPQILHSVTQAHSVEENC
jgi:hypothetical protein